MEMKKMAMAVGLAVVALGSISVAQAVPMLQILSLNNVPLGQEVTGDAGGTSYPWGGGPGGGAGIPSANGGWPNNGVPGPAGYPQGFAQDPSFNNALGTSGYHSGYLNLTESANVTFQFMGGGNSSLLNLFGIDYNGSGTLDGGEVLFQDSHGGNPTNPIQVGGNPPVYGPAIGGGFPTQNEYTIFLNAGLIPFLFVTGNGVTLDNTGNGLGNPDPHDLTQNLPGYFLGVDPYLATGTFQNEGTAVFAGLSDLPSAGDHDFQDMGVRISVPEPGSLFLLGAGLIGLAGLRRRKA